MSLTHLLCFVRSTNTCLQIIHELSSENEELKEELEQAHAAHEDNASSSRYGQMKRMSTCAVFTPQHHSTQAYFCTLFVHDV